MQYKTLRNINQIIERDSKDTTYKFALLRATIEVIQEKSPHIVTKDDRVTIPVGLLVLKWLEYYYPIIEARLPQKSGDNLSTNTLTFRSKFEKLTDYYQTKGGYDVFYKDFIKCGYSDELNTIVYYLCKSIRDTITKQPMKYIGRSISEEYYSIFKKVEGGQRLSKPDKLDVEFMIDRFGRFSIPKDYFSVFEYLGSFITGTHSILINWAKFTVAKGNRSLTMRSVLSKILQSPLNERDVSISTRIFDHYSNEIGPLYCVWSGKKIRSDRNIDHVLPFSVWRNNDLWNLLPTKQKVNSDKNDRIPDVTLLNECKDRIIDYWEFIYSREPEIFTRELKISLVNKDLLHQKNWKTIAFDALKEKSKYLIETRGFEAFNL